MKAQKYFNNKKPINPMIQNRRQADKLIESSHKVAMILTMSVLHDKFGFGTKRLEKFTEHYRDLLESYNAGYIKAEDLNEVLHEETVKIINQVGEDFGWLIGKISANYENGYMKAVRDCKYAIKHSVEVNKMIVTNADRIRSMTDEELANFLKKSCDEQVGLDWCRNHDCYGDCIHKWRKEKVE